MCYPGCILNRSSNERQNARPTGHPCDRDFIITIYKVPAEIIKEH